MKIKQDTDKKPAESDAFDALQRIIEMLNTLPHQERERILRALCVFYEVSL